MWKILLKNFGKMCIWGLKISGKMCKFTWKLLTIRLLIKNDNLCWKCKANFTPLLQNKRIFSVLINVKIFSLYALQYAVRHFLNRIGCLNLQKKCRFRQPIFVTCWFLIKSPLKNLITKNFPFFGMICYLWRQKFSFSGFHFFSLYLQNKNYYSKCDATYWYTYCWWLGCCRAATATSILGCTSIRRTCRVMCRPIL